MGELTAEERAEVARLEAEIAELDAEAQLRIAERTEDPKSQMYFLRLDSKTVVKTQSEYEWCDKKRVPMKMVSFNSANDHMNKELAAARDLAKRRKHNKIARRQARVNRKKR